SMACMIWSRAWPQNRAEQMRREETQKTQKRITVSCNRHPASFLRLLRLFAAVSRGLAELERVGYSVGSAGCISPKGSNMAARSAMNRRQFLRSTTAAAAA